MLNPAISRFRVHAFAPNVGALPYRLQSAPAEEQKKRFERNKRRKANRVARLSRRVNRG